MLVYSDGVSDNLRDAMVMECLEPHVTSDFFNSKFPFYDVAECIAHKAYKKGKDQSYCSPFCWNARQSGYRFLGGKHDDITITVA